MSQMPHSDRTGCRALVSQRFVSLQEQNVSLFTESSHSKRPICQSAVLTGPRTHMQTCHRGERVYADAEREGVTFTQNRQANWGKDLNMVFSCATKVNCHSMSSRFLSAYINSVQNSTPLFTSDHLPGEPIIPCFWITYWKYKESLSEWSL